MALVTIAIPVYNEEYFLRDTLDSALAQRGCDTEIFVCDNSSTDNSYEIARQYEKENERIKVIRHRKNIGAAENFRYCLTLARTKYFAWLGAHDLFTENYIATALEHLESHPEAVLVYPGGAVFVDRNNEIIQEGACSKIGMNNIRSPIERIMFVVKNLGYCTNIHGVFVTEVARKLPFEKIVGPDNLQLAATAFYGEIHEINIQGIRRREIRVESDEDRERRWIEQQIFSQTLYHPRLLLIWKHFELLFNCEKIGVKDKILFLLHSPFIFRWWRPLKMTLHRLLRGVR